MMWMLLLALGTAQECATDLPAITTDASVVWVSRNGKRARGNEVLAVTPTSEVRRWIASQDRATIGGLLRHLGLRKRKKEPRRRFKVVVFDADRATMCRPMEAEAPGTLIGGLPVCEPNLSKATRQHDGCGRSNDPDGRGTPLIRATWADLSAAGFCVLPAARFLDEAS